MRNHVIKHLLTFLVLTSPLNAISSEIDKKLICSSGNVRLLGNVYLQDKKRRVPLISDNPDSSLNNSDITLTIQANTDFLWFREININPDDQGIYLFLGKCADEKNENNSVTASIDGKTIDGKYVMTDPVNVKIESSKVRKDIILRSLENASSAMFDKCNEELNSFGGIYQAPKSQENFREIQDCYDRAESFFEKIEIHGPRGDLYEVFGDFEKCYQVFDKLSYILKARQDMGRYEKSKLRSAICREKNIVTSKNKDEWAQLSNFVRESMQDKISSKNIRVQMMRIWFDSFLRKINMDGNIGLIALKIESDSQIREEWVDLYYRKYFWGDIDTIPQVYKRDNAMKEIKKLSDQFNRTYDERNDGKPKSIKPRGR